MASANPRKFFFLALRGSVLRPLLFFIYINSSPNDLVSICNLFVDDTFIFTIVFDKDKSLKEISVRLL